MIINGEGGSNTCCSKHLQSLASLVVSCFVFFINYVIITLPHELRAFARLHQKQVYGLLIKSAADSIIKLAGDPHYVGGRVGVMAVLHTWGSNLSYHLHVHCLVTGGGLSSDGRTWMPIWFPSGRYRGCFAAASSTVFADNSKRFICRNPYGRQNGSSIVNRPSRAPGQS